MQLNIKDPEAHKLAQRLAKETGETLTDSVIQAIRERLEKVRDEQKGTVRRAADAELRRRNDRLKTLREISAQTAVLLKGKPLDHAELLYDENGLPK